MEINISFLFSVLLNKIVFELVSSYFRKHDLTSLYIYAG